MSDAAKEEIAAMLDKCGSKLVEKLVADPVFDAVRQHMPRGTKYTVVCTCFFHLFVLLTPLCCAFVVSSFHSSLTFFITHDKTLHNTTQHKNSFLKEELKHAHCSGSGA